MSRWYWAAVACAVLFVVTLLMPAYVNEQGGGVWGWQIGIGWNNTDADGNPKHDNLGNRIHPNGVRTVALWAFGLGTVALGVAGYLAPKKRERRIAPPAEGMGPPPDANP